MSNVSTIVWNRACFGGGADLRDGDKYLADLLYFHGPAMNGGVMHAIEFCSSDQLRDAKAGYVYFGLKKAVSVIAKAEVILRNEDNPGNFERELAIEYDAVASDSKLSAHFKKRFEESPEDFAPVQ